MGSLDLKIPTVSGAPDLTGHEAKIRHAAERLYRAIAEKRFLSPSLVSLNIFKVKQNTWDYEKEQRIFFVIYG